MGVTQDEIGTYFSTIDVGVSFNFDSVMYNATKRYVLDESSISIATSTSQILAFTTLMWGLNQRIHIVIFVFCQWVHISATT